MAERPVATLHTQTLRSVLDGVASLPDLDPRRVVQFYHYPVFMTPDGGAEVLLAVDSAAGKLFTPVPVSKEIMAPENHHRFVDLVKDAMLAAATEAESIKIRRGEANG